MATKKSKPARKPQTPHEGRSLTDNAAEAAKAAAAKTATPDRLVWTLNGARWEAPSLKVAGRTYTATFVPDRGWTGGYNGQKAACPASGVFTPLASLARAGCQAVEDSLE